jgi:EmrB/QacA subfamily drug resistance transporter
MHSDPVAPTRPSPGRWLGLAALSVGVAMIIVDATIINVAIPTIISELDIGLVDAEWINSLYALVFAAFLITAGRLGDIVGRRRMFSAGLVVFAAASLLAGVAPDGGVLIAARAAQGLGAAMILPASLSTINATFEGRDRGIAFGVWGSVIGGMAALGPLLGGWLTTELSWRWAFFINLPLALIALVGTVAFVRESRDEEATRGFDLVGFASVTLGLAALVFGLIEGNRYGWIEPKRPFTIGEWTWPLESVSIVAVALVLAAVSLTGFVAWEVRRAAAGKPVLADLRLFRISSFARGNVARAIVSLGEFGLVFVLPLFLSAVLGLTAFETGLVVLPIALGSFVAGPAAFGLAQRLGAGRVVSLGLALEAIAIAVVGLLLAPDLDPLTLALPMLVYGIGVGLAVAQLTSVILVDVPRAASGQASGLSSMIGQLGSALGVALLGTILAVGLGDGTEARLVDTVGLPPAAAAEIAAAVSESAGLVIGDLAADPGSTAVVQAAEAAFVDAARLAAWVAAAFVTLGFIVSLRLPSTVVDEDPTEDIAPSAPATEPKAVGL